MSSNVTNISVEVHCCRPLWATKDPHAPYHDSRYRLYVDDELIIERTWVWNNSTFLKENLWLSLEKLKKYSLMLEPVRLIPEQADFSLNNFKVLNSNATVEYSNLTEISFILV